MLTLCFCFAVPFPQKRKDLDSLAAYHYDAYDEMILRSSISFKLALALHCRYGIMSYKSKGHSFALSLT